MHDKFGLEFRIVDTELLRVCGVAPRPVSRQPVDPLPAADRQRRLAQAGPPDAAAARGAARAPRGYPRAFDLLIVDEVHTCAPSGRGRYAIDSLRTQAIRTLAPHCEHRLFLSATPHNGYQESFTALLELLDDQRFARGVEPDPAQLRRVMVRRLKSELPPRLGRAAAVPDPGDSCRWRSTTPSRNACARERFSRLRRSSRTERAAGDRDRIAVEFALTTLLKKRLFSSPARSPTPSRCTARRSTRARRPTVTDHGVRRREPSVLTDAVGCRGGRAGHRRRRPRTSDEALSQRAFAAAATAEPALTDDERRTLDAMAGWAQRAQGRDDSKLTVFLRLAGRRAGPTSG